MPPLTGVIESFRRGPGTQREDQLIILLPTMDRAEVEKLIGAKVIVRDKYGNRYEGYVKRRHGNGAKILAQFEKGLPGHVLGGDAEIITGN